MQDRQIHVIFGGSCPRGHAQALQKVPLVSQLPKSRQKGARSLWRLLWLSQHLSAARPACLPPTHPPSPPPPPTPPPGPSLQSPPSSQRHWWLWGVSEALLCKGWEGGRAKGQPLPPEATPPDTTLHPNPSHQASACLLVCSDPARAGVHSTYSRPPPQTIDGWTDRHGTAQPACAGVPGCCPICEGTHCPPALDTHTHLQTLS